MHSQFAPRLRLPKTAAGNRAAPACHSGGHVPALACVISAARQGPLSIKGPVIRHVKVVSLSSHPSLWALSLL